MAESKLPKKKDSWEELKKKKDQKRRSQIIRKARKIKEKTNGY